MTSYFANVAKDAYKTHYVAASDNKVLWEGHVLYNLAFFSKGGPQEQKGSKSKKVVRCDTEGQRILPLWGAHS